MSTTMRVNINGRWYSVEVADLEANPVQVIVDGEPVLVDIGELPIDLPQPVAPAGNPGPATEESPAPVSPSPPRQPAPKRTPPPTTSGGKVFSSPMPGVILSVSVEVGAQVVTGDAVCVLEAMKMQQTLRADWTGIVSAVHVEPGQQVAEGDPLVELA